MSGAVDETIARSAPTSPRRGRRPSASSIRKSRCARWCALRHRGRPLLAVSAAQGRHAAEVAQGRTHSSVRCGRAGVSCTPTAACRAKVQPLLQTRCRPAGDAAASRICCIVRGRDVERGVAQVRNRRCFTADETGWRVGARSPGWPSPRRRRLRHLRDLRSRASGPRPIERSSRGLPPAATRPAISDRVSPEDHPHCGWPLSGTVQARLACRVGHAGRAPRSDPAGCSPGQPADPLPPHATPSAAAQPGRRAIFTFLWEASVDSHATGAPSHPAGRGSSERVRRNRRRATAGPSRRTHRIAKPRPACAVRHDVRAPNSIVPDGFNLPAPTA